jgi:hypothetical protein
MNVITAGAAFSKMEVAASDESSTAIENSCKMQLFFLKVTHALLFTAK